MPNDAIKIDTTISTATLAGPAKLAVDAVKNAYAAVLNVRNKMTHLNTGADFTALEAACGLKSTDGQKLFDLFNGAVQAMEGTASNSNVKTMAEQVI